MNSYSKLALSLLIATACSAHAKDLGFRFSNGKCVNATGQSGLNPGFIGQCGDLNAVTMSHFSFDDADLQGSSFENADMQMSSFHGANLTGVSFKSANVSGVDMGNAQLHQVNFSKATLVNLHVAGADILQVDFSAADLSGALLSYSKFTNCKFANAIFGDANLEHTDLSGSDLTAANLSGVDMAGAILDRANLTQVNFRSTNLIGASFVGANANAANFRKASLRDAKMDQGTFISADFIGALLDGTSLLKATLDKSDLRNANLKGAKTNGATLAKVIFNKRTILPFTMTDAISYGMVLTKSGSLLIIDDKSQDAGVEALKEFLESEGGQVVIAKKKYFEFDGMQPLNDYNAVLQLNAFEYSVDMPAAGQTAILAFVKGGGTYIATQWSSFMFFKGGLLQGLKELILTDYQTNLSGELLMIPNPKLKAHPILSGVSDPVSINADWGLGNVVGFDKIPSSILMASADKAPLVIARDVGKGKSVNFAFAPNFNGGTLNVLSQPPVQKLILNTINW